MYSANQAANNKGAVQTARMRRLISVFVVRVVLKQVFSLKGSCATSDPERDCIRLLKNQEKNSRNDLLPYNTHTY